MTTQEILEKFDKLLQANSWWKRFANSQFINMFSVMGSQLIYASQTAADKALTEGFISLATKRSSILAAAEDKGYVARLVVPADGTAIITNKTAGKVAIPLYTALSSDTLNPYTVMEPVELGPGETKTGIMIKQQEVQRLTIPVEEEKEFLSVTLNKEMTSRCAKIDVYVTSGDALNLWEYNPQFRLSKKNSRHYVMFYRPSEQLGIRFGDGSVGMMPGAGENIVIDVWLSEGDITLVQGQTLTPTGAYSTLASSVDIKTDSPITNGAGYESTEETRSRAQYYVAYDEQVVWRADYKHYLRTIIPDISWINVWGEKQQEESDGFKSLKNINTVFICAHKAGMTQDKMKAAILSAIADVPNELNKRFEYVNVNERPFTIELTGTAKKTINLIDAENKIREALENNAGRDSNTFDKRYDEDYARISYNAAWRIVENTGLLSEFRINVKNMAENMALNDFVYINAKDSAINLTYGGSNAV